MISDQSLLLSTIVLNDTYRISSINTASSISTAVWYYSNTNNIEFNVYFNSNAPSNNTAWQREKQDLLLKTIKSLNSLLNKAQ